MDVDEVVPRERRDAEPASLLRPRLPRVQPHPRQPRPAGAGREPSEPAPPAPAPSSPQRAEPAAQDVLLVPRAREDGEPYAVARLPARAEHVRPSRARVRAEVRPELRPRVAQHPRRAAPAAALPAPAGAQLHHPAPAPSAAPDAAPALRRWERVAQNVAPRGALRGKVVPAVEEQEGTPAFPATLVGPATRPPPRRKPLQGPLGPLGEGVSGRNWAEVGPLRWQACVTCGRRLGPRSSILRALLPQPWAPPAPYLPSPLCPSGLGPEARSGTRPDQGPTGSRHGVRVPTCPSREHFSCPLSTRKSMSYLLPGWPLGTLSCV